MQGPGAVRSLVCYLRYGMGLLRLDTLLFTSQLYLCSPSAARHAVRPSRPLLRGLHGCGAFPGSGRRPIVRPARRLSCAKEAALGTFTVARVSRGLLGSRTQLVRSCAVSSLRAPRAEVEARGCGEVLREHQYQWYIVVHHVRRSRSSRAG